MKKIIILTLLFCMIVTEFGYVEAEESKDDSYVGITKFDNITRKIEKTNGGYKTTLSGNGRISNYILVIGDLVVSEGITELGDSVFSSGNSLDSVSLPSTLTSIGNKCFNRCAQISEITIPSGVTKVGENPFYDCQSLKKIVNKSKVKVPAPKFDSYNRGYDYYVDGKLATEVAPGKTMIGKPHKYKLNLKLDGGKLVGKNMKKYAFGKNITLPKAKKKGYDFVGWTDEKEYSNGISKLWRTDLIPGGNQTRYAQFCKVKMTGKKKSIQVKVTNANCVNLCFYYSTKKDRSDEKMIKLVFDNGKPYYYKDGTDKQVYLKGKVKLYVTSGDYYLKYKMKKYKKNYIKVTIPKLKSGKKYYVRLKNLQPYGEEMEKEYGYSNFFGKRTVAVK